MVDKIANRYVIRRLIGQGGMADVYLAWDEVLSREVAIKVLREKLASDPLTLVRFLREASAARRLSHPNVVEIYDVGESSSLHYIVMEYIPGQTLKEMIARTGPMKASAAVNIMKQITSAIVQAHEKQIVHRDIKPQNILISRSGQLKITDFGIALAMDNLSMTRNNAVMGSAHYLAPESAAGLEPDYRVDIYSLGIVFFELLCGSVPFTGTSPAQIALKHMQDPLPPIQPYNETVTQAVENVVIKAAAKDPDERYQSAQELLDALDECMDPSHRNDKPLHLKTTALELPKNDAAPASSLEMTPSNLKPLSHAAPPKSFSWRLTLTAVSICLLVVVFIGYSLISLGIMPVSGMFGWYQVPTVSGLSQQEALDALAEVGFDPDRIRIEEVASDQVEPGKAQSTNVPAGQFVRGDDELVLKIAKGPTFLISDYTGLYLDDVKALFAQNGVTIPVQVSQQPASDTNPGVILSQSGLMAGDRIDPTGKQRISFTVSVYPSIVIDESWIGMDVYQAKEMLNEEGIAVSLRNVYGGSTVSDIDPPVGSTYTQEGSDSVVTLYY